MPQPGPADLLREWQRAIEELTRSSFAGFGDPDLIRRLVAPMQGQTDLLGELLDQQRRFQRELSQGMFKPLDDMRDLLDEAARPMRTQAEALKEAAAALDRVASLLAAQAALVERTSAALRQRTDALRSLLAPLEARDGDDSPSR